MLRRLIIATREGRITLPKVVVWANEEGGVRFITLEKTPI